MRIAVACAALLVVMAPPALAQQPEPAAPGPGGEASLVLPALDSVDVGGYNGRTLLMIGLGVSLLGMMADTSRHTHPANFGALVAEHQTKGGLNERVRQTLLDAGWFDAPGTALSATTSLSYKKLG